MSYVTSTGVINDDLQTLTFDCKGQSTLVVSISGNYAGTIYFSASNLSGSNAAVPGGFNIGQVDGILYSDNITGNADPTGSGSWRFNVAGADTFQLDSSGAGLGTSSNIVFLAIPDSPGIITGVESPITTKLVDNGGAPLIFNQQAMNGSIPVVIASDQTALPISIGSISLPTGASTSANQATEITSLGSIDTNTASTATSLTTITTRTPSLGQALMASSSPVVIASNQSTLDVSIASITAGAASIAKAEDTASADGDVGIPAMAIQKSTPIDLASIDGDYAMIQMAQGRLWTTAKIDNSTGASAVNIQDGGNSITVDGSVTANLATGSNAIGKLAANDNVDIGDVTINNASGGNAVNIQDGGNTITVDGTVTASIAAGASTIAKAEDSAFADTDVGVPAMAIQKSSPANTAGTDGDYAMLQMSAGRLWTSTTITGDVASTIADGADITLGAKGDAKSTATDTTAISAMSVLKQISASVQAPPTQLVIQDVIISSNNTSSANLAAGAAFTGTADNTLGVAAIQVNIIADQNLQIQVQQSNDSTNWDIVDKYNVTAEIGDGRTTQATATYIRIIVTNVGSGATTYLRLSTALCPIAEAIPRSLTASGNLKVAIQESAPLSTNAAQESSGNLALTAEVLQTMLLELRGIRLALTVLACNGGQANPRDFDPNLNDFDFSKF